MMPEKAAPMPVMKCLPRDIGRYKDGMKFWCPYCEAWHMHGRGKGRRVAHCTGSSPFWETGYIIKMMSKAELKQARREMEYLSAMIVMQKSDITIESILVATSTNRRS